MNVSDAQSRYIVTLPPGEAAVFADGMDRPVLARVPNGSEVEKRGGGTIAAVNALIGRRSATCGAECRTDACTLRDMSAAAQLLRTEPWLTIWAELAVLAHLAGRPVPTPTTAARLAFVEQKLPPRLVDCALSHAVDEAVAVRSAVLAPTISPIAVATHVCSALLRMLTGEPTGCDSDGLAYLAVPFRWELVRRALATGFGEERDPRSTEWEQRFRRKLPGGTRMEQLAAVREWLVQDLADTDRVDAVTYGTRRPSALETAIGGDQRLKVALGSFVDCSWPLQHLAPPTRTTN
jgi:hypothetical protein